jgi:CRP/FNR family transcriptional regulator
MDAVSRAEICPMRQQGVQMRDSCAACGGRPEQGQLKLGRGDLLYLEGDAADHVFLLIEGYLRESRSTADGRVQGIRLIRPGEIAGTEGFAQGEYQCSVDAVTEVRACKVNIRAAEERVHARPDQGWAIAQVLARELMSLRDQVLMVGLMTAEERVRAVIESLTRHARSGTWTKLPLTRQEIAGLLGLTQATVSRVFQRLARAHAIEVKGRWVRLP